MLPDSPHCVGMDGDGVGMCDDDTDDVAVMDGDAGDGDADGVMESAQSPYSF